MRRLILALVLVLAQWTSSEALIRVRSTRLGNRFRVSAAKFNPIPLVRRSHIVTSTRDVPVKSLTQKEYLAAIRNKLFLIEEELWLHQHSKSNDEAVIEPLEESDEESLTELRKKLLDQYPLTKLRKDLYDAQQQNLTFAASYLNKLMDSFSRKLPVPLRHVNQIAILSSLGQGISLVRSQGAASHCLATPPGSHGSSNIKRQLQYPVFSPSGRYLAVAAMDYYTGDENSASGPTEIKLSTVTSKDAYSEEQNVRTALSSEGFIHSEVIVFAVPRNPMEYGTFTSLPLFQSGVIPGTPYFLQFSPDERQLVLLCSTPCRSDEEISTGDDAYEPNRRFVTSLVSLPWNAAGAKGSKQTFQSNIHNHHNFINRTENRLMHYDVSSKIDDIISSGNHALKAWMLARISSANHTGVAQTLLQGESLYFTFSTSSRANATIIAHCHDKRVPCQDYENNEKLEFSDGNQAIAGIIRENSAYESSDGCGVWMLQPKEGFMNETNPLWTKISDGDPHVHWTTPICHSAGGGDNALIVEDGWLVTVALSRWKIDPLKGKLYSKRLREVRGQVRFLTAPDSSKVVVLEEDLNEGYYSFIGIDGEEVLDPANSLPSQHSFDIPIDRITLAFFFSPDSSKLLCLTVAGKSRTDISASQNSSMGVGVTSDMQWIVYDFARNKTIEFDVFRPTRYFMETYVPFFTQHAQAFNPWSPDSASFLHVTSTGLLKHIPIEEGKPCVGADRWQTQGVAFGTWSWS